jgi:pSer/pThr/pTyr-binding forkhead associated (FHA) protein
VIADLGSTNGTLVNGRPIQEQVLEDGDTITIGETDLEFRSG